MQKKSLIAACLMVFVSVVVLLYVRGASSLTAEPADSSAWTALERAVPVFRESEYRIKSPRYMVLTTDKVVPVQAIGSGFLIKVNERVLLVTARHVVSGPFYLEELRVGDTNYIVSGTEASSIKKVGERVRLGVKAIKPMLDEFDPNESRLDIAVYLVEDRAHIGAEVLSPGKMEVGSPVTILGYPQNQAAGSGSNVQAVSNVTVRQHSVTALENDYFVCQGEEQVSSGFSGSPVLNQQGEVVGMAVRSNGGQTRCLYIKDLLDEAKRFLKSS